MRRTDDIVKKLKGRTSRRLQIEYKELSKQYWDKHFWALSNMVDEYLEHHRHPSNRVMNTMILE